MTQKPLPQHQAGLLWGLLVDAQGRCAHYHSDRDVLGNLCGACGRYLACFVCHAALFSHPFEPVSRQHPASMCCGVCQRTFGYADYAQTASASGEGTWQPHCPHCAAPMNPGCRLHEHLYFCTD